MTIGRNLMFVCELTVTSHALPIIWKVAVRLCTEFMLLWDTMKYIWTIFVCMSYYFLTTWQYITSVLNDHSCVAKLFHLEAEIVSLWLINCLFFIRTLRLRRLQRSSVSKMIHHSVVKKAAPSLLALAVTLTSTFLDYYRQSIIVHTWKVTIGDVGFCPNRPYICIYMSTFCFFRLNVFEPAVLPNDYTKIKW